MRKKLPIISLNGDSWSCPGSTLESFLSAIGAGCDALAINISMTNDGMIFCYPEREEGIDDLAFEDIEKIDAGRFWSSAGFGAEKGELIIKRGRDNPWAAVSGKKPLISFPTLEYVLQNIHQRTVIYFVFSSRNINNSKVLIEKLMLLIQRFGLAEKCFFIGGVDIYSCLEKEGIDASQLCLDARDSDDDELFSIVSSKAYPTILLDFPGYLFIGSHLRLDDFNWFIYIGSSSCYKRQFLELEAIVSFPTCVGLLIPNISAVDEYLQFKNLIIEDALTGGYINSKLWRLGISHASTNVIVKQYKNIGVVIDLAAGGSYTGGACICKIAICDDFDVQVDFSVENPQQGTTLELAAITINPSYKPVNLCFDVHGAPPYVSSECDEDNGFRGGVNNSYTLTQFRETPNNYFAEAWSSNLYNTYTKNVGTPKKNASLGSLRLTRRGDIFNTYYKDEYNQSWVCSSSILSSNMTKNSYIRLAAKHWKKSNTEPPANKIVFKNFKLYQ